MLKYYRINGKKNNSFSVAGTIQQKIFVLIRVKMHAYVSQN